MRTIAFTMWQNDLVILKLWLKYYSQHFTDLHVLCHSTKEEYHPILERLKDEYNMTYSILDEPFENPEICAKMLSEKQNDYVKGYDWVLYTNCDEFLIPDPKRYKSLTNLMRYSRKLSVPCEGYDVIQVEGESPIDFSKPYLKQRKYWLRNKNYNKIILSRVPLVWHKGQHRTMDMEQPESMAIDNTGLFLVHLKHADLNPAGERDFGPLKTSHERWVSEGIEKKQYGKIPDKVREQL